MGQKVNPTGLRLKINRTWDSRWFATKMYGELLIQDITIRSHIFKTLSQAAITKIIIERPTKKPNITIYTARPGVIIGKKGADIDKVKLSIQKLINSEVSLNIVEVRKPEIDAQLVADNITRQIEGRGSYRRAMKRAMQASFKVGALGMRVMVSGRLGGTEIARSEEYREGRVPLHTLRADIDYGFSEAFTTYGVIGVKVWIYKGEIIGRDPLANEKRASSSMTNAHQ